MEKNIFGNSEVINIDELRGSIYFTCAACMSVWADALSWANANRDRIATLPEYAHNIVTLSCQVTDLAIINDLCTAEKLLLSYPGANHFISGCLGQRFDINLQDGIERLSTPSVPSEPILNRNLINFEKPFWVNNFKDDGNDLTPGNMFRNMYPLRISRGCHFKCTYCTIRVTRGAYVENEPKLKEFLENDNILLIADSPTENQLKFWINAAIKNEKTISIRNVEPRVVVEIKKELLTLAKLKLLKVFHSPIQSNSPKILNDMRRLIPFTWETMRLSEKLKKMGVVIATNVIVDYKDFKQDLTNVYDLYDYVSWNPYWDGEWNRDKAIERFNHYQKFFTDNKKMIHRSR